MAEMQGEAYAHEEEYDEDEYYDDEEFGDDWQERQEQQQRGFELPPSFFGDKTPWDTYKRLYPKAGVYLSQPSHFVHVADREVCMWALGLWTCRVTLL